MVDVRFTYSDTGYPIKRDQTTFENIATERINEFFNDRKVQQILKEPTTLELSISRKNELTVSLPTGEVFTRTTEEIIAEFKKLIEELRNI